MLNVAQAGSSDRDSVGDCVERTETRPFLRRAGHTISKHCLFDLDEKGAIAGTPFRPQPSFLEKVCAVAEGLNRLFLPVLIKRFGMALPHFEPAQ